MAVKSASAVIVWTIWNLASNETVGWISSKTATLTQTPSNIDGFLVMFSFVTETSALATVVVLVAIDVSIIDVAVIAQIMKVRHIIHPVNPKFS